MAIRSRNQRSSPVARYARRLSLGYFKYPEERSFTRNATLMTLDFFGVPIWRESVGGIRASNLLPHLGLVFLAQPAAALDPVVAFKVAIF
jgi:hypothetical protein